MSHLNNLVLFLLFLGSITITPQDSRWVGAWWLGFLIGGVISFLAAIPFCFLPKSLKKPGEANHDKTSSSLLENTGAIRKTLTPAEPKPMKWSTMMKGKCFVCCINMESNWHKVLQKCDSSSEYFASHTLHSKRVSYPQERKCPISITRSQGASSRTAYDRAEIANENDR